MSLLQHVKKHDDDDDDDNNNKHTCLWNVDKNNIYTTLPKAFLFGKSYKSVKNPIK